MFYESHYPKKELKDISKELKWFSVRFLLHNNWIYKLEKGCFIWFYFVRKLLESKNKVTDRVRHYKVDVKSYKFIWKKTWAQPFWFDNEYDYKNPLKETLTIKDLTHQFIHSQLFFWSKEWKWLRYILLTSDKYIYDRIYEVDIEDIIKIFIVFSEDYVTKISSTYNEKSWNYVIKCS